MPEKRVKVKAGFHQQKMSDFFRPLRMKFKTTETVQPSDNNFALTHDERKTAS